MVKYTFGAGLSQAVLLILDTNMTLRPKVQVERDLKDGRLTRIQFLTRERERSSAPLARQAPTQTDDEPVKKCMTRVGGTRRPRRTQTVFKGRPLCPTKRLGHHHSAGMHCATGHSLKD